MLSPSWGLIDFLKSLAPKILCFNAFPCFALIKCPVCCLICQTTHLKSTFPRLHRSSTLWTMILFIYVSWSSCSDSHNAASVTSQRTNSNFVALEIFETILCYAINVHCGAACIVYQGDEARSLFTTAYKILSLKCPVHSLVSLLLFPLAN